MIKLEIRAAKEGVNESRERKEGITEGVTVLAQIKIPVHAYDLVETGADLNIVCYSVYSFFFQYQNNKNLLMAKLLCAGYDLIITVTR